MTSKSPRQVDDDDRYENENLEYVPTESEHYKPLPSGYYQPVHNEHDGHVIEPVDENDDYERKGLYGKRPRLDISQHRNMNMAVTGCSHGEMDKIYETIVQEEKKRNIKIDLLICCGDFQAVRNRNDLQHVQMPPKYRQLMTFHKYYSGEKVAPVLTIFVGGNHESSGFMAELPNGGWVAPNIYYMGYASVLRVGGLRIAGLSGIYKPKDYDRGHFERPPYSENTLKSAYHVRSVDVFRLRQLRIDEDEARLDMVVSHDWPAGITDFGNVDALLRVKPFFRADIERNELGNPATMDLLHELKPRRWFAAHMHVRFEAAVTHHDKDGSLTKFLALDKPLPRRKFLEFFQIPLDASQRALLAADGGRIRLYHDPEWLVILKNTDFLTAVTGNRVYMPGRTSAATERFDFRPTAAELAHVRALFNDDFHIPLNFRQTAPPLAATSGTPYDRQSLYYRNPISTEFCEKLGIRDLNHLLCLKQPEFVGVPHYCETTETACVSKQLIEEAIRLADEAASAADEAPRLTRAAPAGPSALSAANPDEIDICTALDDDEEESGEADGIVKTVVASEETANRKDLVRRRTGGHLPAEYVEETNDYFVVDPTPQDKKFTVL